MANGLVLNANLVYTGNNLTVTDTVPTLSVTVTGNGLVSLSSVTVPTTPAAIPTGSLTGGAGSGGWIFVKNLDATNYMTIETATSGTAFATLYPGEFCLLRLAPGLTAPFWSAHTATVQAELAWFDI
jgi:hypothetical protein